MKEREGVRVGWGDIGDIGEAGGGGGRELGIGGSVYKSGNQAGPLG